MVLNQCTLSLLCLSINLMKVTMLIAPGSTQQAPLLRHQRDKTTLKYDNAANQYAPLIEFFYWNVDPFFHMTKDYNIHGIIYEAFKKAEIYCGRVVSSYEENASSRRELEKLETSNRKERRESCRGENVLDNHDYIRPFVRYQKVAVGHQLFHDILFDPNRQEKIQYKRASYKGNFSKPLLEIWGVIYTKESKEWIESKLNNHHPNINNTSQENLDLYKLTISKKISVIMDRSRISLISKVFHGIANCTEPLMLSILCSIIFGILLWFIEQKNYNGEESTTINENFFIGGPDAIWCSFVSMTTVGYGDIYPRTLLGKIAMALWVTFGLVMIAVMCGTVFDTISTPPNVYGLRVAVIPNTPVERFVRENLETRSLVFAPTYRDLFKIVQQGRADAALINSDVYVAYQQEFRDQDIHSVQLHAVQEFKVDQPVYIATKFGTYPGEISNGTTARKLYDCMTINNRHLIFRIPVLQEPLQVRIESVFVAGIYQQTILLYLSASVLFTFAMCVACRLAINRAKNAKEGDS